jgi:proteasome lid subunit RPN8/RPN11
VATEPTRRYTVDPAEHFAQVHRCRRINERQGTQYGVVGAYHSHPARGATPSADDHAESFSNFVFLIVGFVEGGGVDVQAYVREADRLTAQPLGVH